MAYLDHDFLEPDHNKVERAMRPVDIGRQHYLFVCSQTGDRSSAIAYILTKTATLNVVDPQGWLAYTLARIPDYMINCVDGLLPLSWSDHAACPVVYHAVTRAA